MSHQGEIETTYNNLVSVFGLPTYGSDMIDEKSTCEWIIKFKDGTRGFIYDWKEEKTIYGKYNWHIGGTSPDIVREIILLMNNHK